MTVARPVQGSFLEGMERPVGPILPSVFKGSNAESFDTVCFDPPYVISGGKSSGSLADVGFQDRYGIGTANLGMTNSAAGNATLHSLIGGGLAESIRVARSWVLVKCMEFAQGSHCGTDFQDLPWLVRKWALNLGVVTHDVIVHHTGSGPGGHNIFNIKRARRHHSYLIVFKKGTKR